MSDLTIPGVKSNIDTEKMIQALMDAERVPLKRMESEVEEYKSSRRTWQDLNTVISRVKDSANKLWSYNNPFEDKLAVSSDNTVLTAVATRKAIEAKQEITVKQVATSDRFLSASLSTDFKVDAGTYRFRIGKEEISFSFPGGTVSEFVEMINKKGRNLLKASVVKDTKSTQVIVIESLKTGKNNQLIFLDKAIDFGLKSGMLKKTTTSSLNVTLNNESIKQLETPLAPDTYSLQDDSLSVNPTTSLQIPIRPPFTLNEHMVLEYEVKTKEISAEEIQETAPVTGPVIPDAGYIEHKGIRIYNEKSKVIPPEAEQPPQPPARVDDMNVLFFRSQGQTIALPKITDSQDYIKVQVPIGKMAKNIESLIVKNNNTNRSIQLRNISIVDPTARGDYVAANPISQAGDAVVELNGVEIVRDTNEIDDLIPEVTITLLNKSDKPVQLSIERDFDVIKEDIVAFIGNYNQLITEIDILTRNKESVITDATYLTEEEKKNALAKLGTLQGDVTLMNLKTSLQRIMMNPYKTEGDRQMVLLAQMGISTNAGTGTTGTLDKTLLRGYLQIDEGKLTQALKAHPEWAKELFGNDTDGDLVVDTGVAFTVDSYLKPYINTGGIIDTRVATLNSQLARKQTEIKNYNEHLEDYEAKLRRKYGMMEGMLDALEKNSQSLKNLNQGNK
jgi:flagellar hook-associated protein 2